MAGRAEKCPLIHEARHFAIDELFFSTTDLKGKILKANSVFLRIAEYSPEEILGKPHNVIRHPHMPRIIFRTMWEYLHRNQQIVAYVKNRAKDGRHYWVFALVTPTQGGYLSVRMKPCSDLFPTVTKAYADLRACEARIEDAGGTKAEGMEASSKALTTFLTAQGFNSYDEFMHCALEREIRTRDTLLTHQSVRSGVGIDERAGTQQRGYAELLSAVGVIFADLDAYASSKKAIQASCDFLNGLSLTIRRLALNGDIETEQLGPAGAGVGKVLEFLQLLSKDLTAECQDLEKPILAVIEEIESIIFNLGAARLQIEMTLRYVGESTAALAQTHAELMGGAVPLLQRTFAGTIEAAQRSLGEIHSRLQSLARASSNLNSSMRSLRLIHVTGRIEMARSSSAQLDFIFTELSRKLVEAENNLQTLQSDIVALDRQLAKSLQNSAAISTAEANLDAVLAETSA